MITKQEFDFDFLGFGWVRSRCKVHVISEDDIHLILFENLGIGTSVTNASEQLASQIINISRYEPEKCRFFETYKENDYDSFDEITYTWNHKRTFREQDWTSEWIYEADNPQWSPALKMKEKFLK
jgi:hypothetical protein